MTKNKKMNHKYTIDELIETFKDHAMKSEKYRKIARERYKENNNGTDLPYDDSFNLPMALKVICEEILQLKKDMKHGKIFQRFP